MANNSVRLDYRTFEKILLKHCNMEIATDGDESSHHAITALELDAIILKSGMNDDEIDRFDNGDGGKSGGIGKDILSAFRSKKELYKWIVDAYTRRERKETEELVSWGFAEDIMPLLAKTVSQRLRLALLDIILNDREIPEGELARLKSSYVIDSEELFLAKCFVFAVTRNKIIDSEESVEPNAPEPPFFSNVVNQPGAVERVAYLEKLARNFNRTDDGDNIAPSRIGQRIAGTGVKAQILYGMPGTGKSFLTDQYAVKYAHLYNAIWRFNAGSEAELRESCRQIAEQLDRRPYDKMPEEIKRLYLNYFNHHDNWLLIFDNVDYLSPEWSGDKDVSHLRDALLSYLPAGGYYTHVLITTRCNCDIDLLGAGRIEVGPFNKEAALSYINTLTGISGQDDNAEKLTDELDYLPLALYNAGTYIRQSTQKSYSDYLEKYNQKKIAMLDMKPLASEHLSICATFRMTLDRYDDLDDNENRQQARTAARQFFNICAVTAPERIALIPFIEGAGILPEPLKSVLLDDLLYDLFISELTKYSLCHYDADEQAVSVNRMFQEVVLADLEAAGEAGLWREMVNKILYHSFQLFRLNRCAERIDLRERIVHLDHTVLAQKYDFDHSWIKRQVVEDRLHADHAYLRNRKVSDEAFLEDLRQECVVLKRWLQEEKAKGREHADWSALYHMQLWERYHALGDEQAEKHLEKAYKTTKDILAAYRPRANVVSPFVETVDAMSIFRTLYVFFHTFKTRVEKATPGEVWEGFRLIFGTINKMGDGTWSMTTPKAKRSLEGVLYSAAQLLSDLTGKAVWIKTLFPERDERSGESAIIISTRQAVAIPGKHRWIDDTPISYITWLQIMTIHDRLGNKSHAVKVRPELISGFDLVLDDEHKAPEALLDIDSDDAVIVALPDYCISENGLRFLIRNMIQTKVSAYQEIKKMAPEFADECLVHYDYDEQMIAEEIDKIVNTGKSARSYMKEFWLDPQEPRNDTEKGYLPEGMMAQELKEILRNVGRFVLPMKEKYKKMMRVAKQAQVQAAEEKEC